MRERIRQFLLQKGFVLSLSATLLLLIVLLVNVNGAKSIDYKGFQAVFLDDSLLSSSIEAVANFVYFFL